jgi:hypothetical protein
MWSPTQPESARPWSQSALRGRAVAGPFHGLLGHAEIDALADGLHGVKSWAARLSRWRRRSMDNSDP